MSRHSLVLGGTLDLTADTLHGCKLSVLGQDMSLGSPMPIESAVRSLIQDGAILRTQGYENAEVAFNIMLEAPDSLSLNEAEAVIWSLLGKPTTLEWTPPDGLVTTVYDIVTSRLAESFDDMDALATRRRYVIVLTRLPWARSTTQIVENSGGAPSSPGTIVNNCESTTGWGRGALDSSVPPAVDTAIFHEGAGSVRMAAGSYSYGTSQGSPAMLALSTDMLTGLSIDTGIGGYMSIWIRTLWTDTVWDNYFRPIPSGVETMRVQYDGRWGGSQPWDRGEVPFVASEVAPDGFVRYVWRVEPGRTVTGLYWEVKQHRWGYDSAVPQVWYDALALSTAATTDNQIVIQRDIKGAVRAPGSIRVSAPDDGVALGSVLVATVAETEVGVGFRPDMRRWVTAGSTTTDATALHGSYFSAPSDFGSGVQFEAPVSMFRPGNYAAVMLVKTSSPDTVYNFGVQAQLTFGGVATGAPSVAEVHTAVPNGWTCVPVGTVRIPDVKDASTTARIRVRIKGSTPVSEVFLVPEAAAMTIAECGSGTVSGSGASSHLWLEAPTPANPSGAAWRGPSLSGTNRRRLSLVSELRVPGNHLFEPGRMLCWCVTTGAQGPTVETSYYPHGHTNAPM